MSSTNPRFIRKIWSSDELRELHHKTFRQPELPLDRAPSGRKGQ
jgi:hypothetical protein